MDREKFLKAISLNEEINELKKHRKELIDSKIEYGGGLIFHYNTHYQDITLKNDIFGEDFFKKYIKCLDEKISKLENEFNCL